MSPGREGTSMHGANSMREQAVGTQGRQGFAAVTWVVALGLTASLLMIAVGLFG
jgi:hypothetical protein